jgi:hypothetical protein
MICIFDSMKNKMNPVEPNEGSATTDALYPRL